MALNPTGIENSGDGQILTLKQLCDRLQIDESTYHRNRNTMPTPIRIGVRVIRFPIATVKAWEGEQVRREQLRRLDRAN